MSFFKPGAPLVSRPQRCLWGSAPAAVAFNDSHRNIICDNERFFALLQPTFSLISVENHFTIWIWFALSRCYNIRKRFFYSYLSLLLMTVNWILSPLLLHFLNYIIFSFSPSLKSMIPGRIAENCLCASHARLRRICLIVFRSNTSNLSNICKRSQRHLSVSPSSASSVLSKIFLKGSEVQLWASNRVTKNYIKHSSVNVCEK